MGGGISDWEVIIRLGGGMSDWEGEYRDYQIGRENASFGGVISDWEVTADLIIRSI